MKNFYFTIRVSKQLNKCWDRLWYFCLCSAWSSWGCSRREVGLDDLQTSLPNWISVWFCKVGPDNWIISVRGSKVTVIILFPHCKLWWAFGKERYRRNSLLLLIEHAFYKYANAISIISSACKYLYPISANILFKQLKI